MKFYTFILSNKQWNEIIVRYQLKLIISIFQQQNAYQKKKETFLQLLSSVQYYRIIICGWNAMYGFLVFILMGKSVLRIPKTVLGRKNWRVNWVCLSIKFLIKAMFDDVCSTFVIKMWWVDIKETNLHFLLLYTCGHNSQKKNPDEKSYCAITIKSPHIENWIFYFLLCHIRDQRTWRANNREGATLSCDFYGRCVQQPIFYFQSLQNIYHSVSCHRNVYCAYTSQW